MFYQLGRGERLVAPCSQRTIFQQVIRGREFMPSESNQMTIPKFGAMKGAGQKITMLTAYDYTMAGLLDATGVEGILVGDSMSMVVQGHSNTLPVTLDEMIYHAEMVGRAVEKALVV